MGKFLGLSPQRGKIWQEGRDRILANAKKTGLHLGICSQKPENMNSLFQTSPIGMYPLHDFCDIYNILMDIGRTGV